MYPNPIGNEDLIIDVSKTFIPNTQFNLFDINGKIYFSQTLIEGINTIKIQSLPIGLYFIKLINENNVQTFKLIKNE
jgi:hypothetical protein